MAKTRPTTRPADSRTPGIPGTPGTPGTPPTDGTVAAPKRRRTTKAAASAAPDIDAPRSGDGSVARAPKSDSGGKHLVIVESPTKAKTINKYLGRDYVVMASVGHVRDLPASAPKGTKRGSDTVPGVDLAHDFAPTYEVMPTKKKTVTDLRRAAKGAADVWFATDLDREGEAIAWHLAEALDLNPAHVKRVVFNAITKSEIQHAFASPRPIDVNRVNAQQARRILDRIVGYQVSPLLWKKVAGGLSAGRVQSVAVRLVVEREREIEAFIPQEQWRVAGYFAVELSKLAELSKEWRAFLHVPAPIAGSPPPQDFEPRTQREKLAWLSEHRCLRGELVEVDGKPFEPTDRDAALTAARGLGFALDTAQEWQDPKGRGPARFLCLYHGHMEKPPRFAIQSIQTKRTTARPPAPFITSSLQQAAANRLGFPLQRTMRIAQQLYEGVNLKGAGQTGLITYMRTDSTHLSGEALNMARGYIKQRFGDKYLPEKPNFFASPNKAAQEAHEAVRPTDASLTPDSIRASLSDEQFKLYKLIWERFIACQMSPAEWDSTSVMIEAKGTGPTALFKATGRTLVFDGYLKVAGIAASSEEAILPPIKEGQEVGALQIDPTQHFTSPPPRYSEASLQKKLEEEGIGRPSTYAAIISTIQDRKYAQQMGPRDRRLFATDLGKVVTDKLVEAFPKLLDVGYTRYMEAELDKIEEEHHDWVQMLHEFYGPFKKELDAAHGTMTHAKAETEPAPAQFKCADCGAPTVYRFGKAGRFLSCSRYPDCRYAARIDREGNPIAVETTDVMCPLDGGAMTRRTGRFGPFLGCINYPTCKGILKLDPKKGHMVLPKPPPLLTDIPCTKCGSPLNLRRSARGPWLSCSAFPKCRGRVGWTTVEEPKQKELEIALAKHEAANPVPPVKNSRGEVLGDQYMPQILGGEGETAATSADAEPAGVAPGDDTTT